MAAQFTSATSLDEESEMLPQDPPPLIIRFGARLDYFPGKML